MKHANLAAATLNALIFVALPAAATEYYQLADGTMFHVHVAPAASTRVPTAQRAALRMHGGTPTWGEQYHIRVTLFDDASDKRIDDARIKATLFDATKPGNRLPGPFKELEPMHAGSETAYGNYFNIPSPMPYRIELEVLRPGRAEVARASFEYRHALVATQPRTDGSH